MVGAIDLVTGGWLRALRRPALDRAALEPGARTRPAHLGPHADG
jgi:hypothetical protein